MTAWSKYEVLAGAIVNANNNTEWEPLLEDLTKILRACHQYNNENGKYDAEWLADEIFDIIASGWGGWPDFGEEGGGFQTDEEIAALRDNQRAVIAEEKVVKRDTSITQQLLELEN